MIEVIKDAKSWKDEIASLEHNDFYYTYDYHQISKSDNEEPILVKYTDNQTVLFIPLLLRHIEGSDFKDATSVYGYAGPLVQHIDENFNKDIFQNELNAFFNENDIIAVFSRLHPYMLHQETVLDGLGTVTSLGKVVNIDLNDTIENQRAKFNRRLKTYLNKSRRSCSVIKASKEEHLDAFIELYHENMRRVDADDSYFFSNEYYKQILSMEDYESELSLCVHNETQNIIGAAMFIKKGKIVQYHLSGLSEDYFELNPIKLIIDEMRIKSTQDGYEYFNLGGGLGGNEDSLFRFKSGFSKDFRTFKTWKYVVNEDAYNKLIEQKLGKDFDLNAESANYFPAYRIKLNTDNLQKVKD